MGLEKVQEAAKKARAKLKKQQVKFPAIPKGTNTRKKILESQKGKFKPGKAPAKSIAQTRNANIVSKFFGGTRKIPKGGGGGFGAQFTQGTGTFDAFKRRK